MAARRAKAPVICAVSASRPPAGGWRRPRLPV